MFGNLLKLVLFLGGELYVKTVLDIYNRKWDEEEQEWVHNKEDGMLYRDEGNWILQGPGV